MRDRWKIRLRRWLGHCTYCAHPNWQHIDYVITDGALGAGCADCRCTRFQP